MTVSALTTTLKITLFDGSTGWLGHGVLAMAAPAQGAPNIWVQLAPFAVVLAIFYFVILMPMRRRQQKVQAFLGALKVGDNVVTTGGMYGSITRIGDDSVQLQIAERVRIEISRNAIIGYQGQEPVASEKA
jgi:preprotein translocase subunit YajC